MPYCCFTSVFLPHIRKNTENKPLWKVTCQHPVIIALMYEGDVCAANTLQMFLLTVLFYRHRKKKLVRIHQHLNPIKMFLRWIKQRLSNRNVFKSALWFMAVLTHCKLKVKNHICVYGVTVRWMHGSILRGYLCQDTVPSASYHQQFVNFFIHTEELFNMAWILKLLSGLSTRGKGDRNAWLVFESPN